MHDVNLSLDCSRSTSQWLVITKTVLRKNWSSCKHLPGPGPDIRSHGNIVPALVLHNLCKKIMVSSGIVLNLWHSVFGREPMWCQSRASFEVLTARKNSPKIQKSTMVLINSGARFQSRPIRKNLYHHCQNGALFQISAKLANYSLFWASKLIGWNEFSGTSTPTFSCLKLFFLKHKIIPTFSS